MTPPIDNDIRKIFARARVYGAVAALLMPAAFAALPAVAEERPPLEILGQPVEPHDGSYLVLKDANVRAKPLTKSKRVGRLEAGSRVNAVGRVKGPWLAVARDGKPLGFVYGPILMPVVDGALGRPIEGDMAIDGLGDCSYRIEHLGKTPAEGQRFEFSDYGVDWRCRRKGGKTLAFHSPMFLTEGPYQGTRTPVHQITVDLMELAGSLEEVFSTHVLWDRQAGTVKFDSLSVKKFGRAKTPEPLAADSVDAALRAALRLVSATWSDSVWAALAKPPESD